jgi:hypothetical protein
MARGVQDVMVLEAGSAHGVGHVGSSAGGQWLLTPTVGEQPPPQVSPT